MALNAKKAGGGNKDRIEQPLIEADVYRGRLVQIIDLGLQAQKPYQGKEKAPVQEVMFTYELVDVFMVDKDGEEDEEKPRWISETLPFYGLFADKAKSTKRYFAFDPNEQYDGELAKCIDTPVNITIVNNKSGDKVYSNIGDVATMSAKKAATCPELKNPAKVFDLDEPDMEVFNALPQWIQDKIKSNLNFKGSALEKALENGGEKKEDKKAPAKKQEAKADNPPFDADEDENNPY